MRLLLAVLLAALVAPAAAGAATVDLLVVGKDGGVLKRATAVTPAAAKVRAGRKRCAVAALTPLAALLRARLALSVRDYGSCGRRAGDSASLFVRSVAGQRARGQDGWVYKVGTTVPSVGAADPSARLDRGARLTWFWCRMGTASCQRTLAVRAPASATAGQPFTVTVTGYDDTGAGKPVAGATVTGAGATATTNAAGRASLTATAGRVVVSATKKGLVRSFPSVVGVR